MSSSTNAVKRESIHLSMTDFCMTAVCMALTCIATMLIQIPIPLGYAHLTGYPVWAVPTLLIKTIMPLIACYIFQNKVSRKPVISVRVLVGAVVTLLFMTAGYVFFGGILYGSWALGLASAPGLLLKSVVNLIVFIVVGTGLSKVVKNR